LGFPKPNSHINKTVKKSIIFQFQTVQHGFPHKPSAVAYDPISKLMAIGTNSGVVKVFGRPGVEFYGQHQPGVTSPNQTNSAVTGSDTIIQILEWIPGNGRLLSLTTSNQLTLWEPAGTMLVPIKNCPFDGKLKKISSLCCSYLKDLVWIGTEGGNVYQFDLKTFQVKEDVIFLDVIVEQ
jgi:lethal(2) giant larvae protein